ncbi:putative NAD(P) oxidoreductase, FAD-containing subunit [Candidatus Kuenenia stuttgartiensis]|uniref:Putative NAD(P) oxidoreductase, FAD-containing subunit n=1 Tax=Kuenenia stuttgartiensis TaxID=174633 RepID=Q1Q5P1_KUEST|nr:FAD-dependent oxidoreductase [Planctomycetia bacterium]MBZ0193439.1 FAD-dependent oxidoreductase [Candidatus Kuenenia stuttgartiensis]MCF6150759.1 FAD-binding protein [Candidatus Kuenenia stuttgartiensis]MCL4727520.1 FAD-dependent oxidoreductase [Candidatus Kuenenia stuttgartiensis]QII12346.1 putative NAD(P) oxidoreductase, FAD-containing subunit [Candidatus Kuenenia stuttgartiensis]
MTQTTIPEQGIRALLDLDWLRENIRCQHRCPAHMDVPGYIRLISQGKFEESYRLMKETNPFPAVCGYVCPHPCESKCKRGDFDRPVAIDALKRFVTDYVFKNKIKIPAPAVVKKKQKVAIIGAGPAGLTAAFDLAGMGYKVTVFEKEAQVGGMMMWAIPSYRLPRDQIMFDVSHILERGVQIKTNTPIGGKGKSFSDLLEMGYDAVFIAVGAQIGKRLEIAGEEGTDGVMDCLVFLKNVSAGDTRKPGENIVVIGGGNSAVDAARTAKRLSKNVSIVYRRTREEMPALSWEVEEAEHEGVSFHFLAAPVKIVTENGKAKGLECIKMRLGKPDESGRRRPEPIPDSTFIIDTDCVISAISQEPDLKFLGDKHGLKVNKWGTIAVDGNLATSKKGIFAGGDVTLGPSTIIECIAQGHLAANSIDRFINGEPLEEPKKKVWVTLLDSEIDLREENYDATLRQDMRLLPEHEREGNFDLVELGLDEFQAAREANRCLKCDLTINVETNECVLCGRCSMVCPVGALKQVDAFDQSKEHKPFMSKDGIVIKYTDKCIRCGNCKDCPVNVISMKRVLWKPNEDVNKFL